MTLAAALGIGFDAVVCASGSALTHAGVLVGLRALGEAAPVYQPFLIWCARSSGSPGTTRWPAQLAIWL